MSLHSILRLLIILISVCFASCKTANIYESDSSSTSSVERSMLLKHARKLIGAPYKYAGKGPRSFDCSGMVAYVYDQADIHVGGSAAHIADHKNAIELEDAQTGDLVFFKKGGKVFHVSMISKANRGELWVIHSTTSRGVIEEEILSSTYWQPKIWKAVSLRSYK